MRALLCRLGLLVICCLAGCGGGGGDSIPTKVTEEQIKRLQQEQENADRAEKDHAGQSQ